MTRDPWARRPVAALAVATVALLLATTALGAALYHATQEAREGARALEAAQEDAAQAEAELRELRRAVDGAIAQWLHVAADILGPELRLGGEAAGHERELTRAADALLLARALSEGLGAPANGTLIPAINVTLRALDWTRSAQRTGDLPAESATPHLNALSNALHQLASEVRPESAHGTAPTPHPPPGDPLGAAADRVTRAATNLTQAAHDHARAGMAARTDIRHARLAHENGTWRAHVTLAAPPPTSPPRWGWELEVCVRERHHAEPCTSTHRFYSSSFGRVNASNVTFHGATATMDAPPGANATGYTVRVASHMQRLHAYDACRAAAGSLTCEDAPGDASMECLEREVAVEGCPGPGVRLTFSIDPHRLANGTISGRFALENNGEATRVLPLVPHVTLHVEVRDATTGEEVPWYGSDFGAPEPFTDADLRALTRSEVWTYVTFPGQWLTEPGGAYNVTATYRPTNDDGVRSAHWATPVRSQPLTVRT